MNSSLIYQQFIHKKVFWLVRPLLMKHCWLTILFMNYHLRPLIVLMTPDSFDDPCCSNSTVVPKPIDDSALIYAVFTVRIEFLEAQKKSLVKQLTESILTVGYRTQWLFGPFLHRIFIIWNSFAIFEFFGPAVDNLQYWGSKSVIKHHKKNWIHLLINYFLP